MKILHLSSESSWRGGEQQIAYLIEELEQNGVKPLIAGRPNSEFSKYAKQRNWAYINLKMKNSTDVSSSLRLKSICKEKKVDIIHAHSSRSHSIAYWAYLLGNKTDIVLSRRVDFPPKNNFLSKNKYNIKAIRKIACVSDAIRYIITPVLKDLQKCITIYSGIDHSKFEHFKNSNWLREHYDISSNTRLIGNTSAIAPHKDYFTFIDTAKAFVANYEHEVKFFVIGSGPMEEEIKAYCKANGMDKHIIFTGFLKNINEVLPSLDVFFISSETEGLGTSILDAFACRVPVVATEAGGIPEIVKHKETGLTAPIKSTEQLARHLDEILTNKSLRDTIVESAYKLSLDLGKQQMAAQYYEVYKQVIDEK